jgi:hypothetical protein
VEVSELEEDNILGLGKCLGETDWNVLGRSREALEFDRIVAFWFGSSLEEKKGSRLATARS